MNAKKRCRNCKTYQPAEETLSLNGGNYCNIDCATSYAQRKATEKREKAQRADTRKRKESLKTKPQLTKEAQKAFNAYIRERDKERECISCGRIEVEELHGGAWDCGHYLSVGAYPELRFDERNAHKQCKSCNAGSGKYTKKNYTVTQEYRERLIERIGIDAVNDLEGPNDAAKHSHDDLRNIAKYYKMRLREIRK